MSRMYLAPPDSQTPDRSGWPSADRGAGAERLGLPSGPFGIPPAGTFTHWPYTGAQTSTTMPNAGTAEALIVAFLLPAILGGCLKRYSGQLPSRIIQASRKQSAWTDFAL